MITANITFLVSILFTFKNANNFDYPVPYATLLAESLYFLGIPGKFISKGGGLFYV